MDSKNAIIKERVLSFAENEGNYPTSIKGLRIARRNSPTEFNRCFYEPVCIYVVQGQKQAIFGSDGFIYKENQFVISCTDVPASSRVVKASKDEPCLVLVLELDSFEISKLIIETQSVQTIQSDEKYLASADSDEFLTDAFFRLTELLDKPQSQQNILAPMIIKEIYYRLLTGPLGNQLHLINSKGTQANLIAEAITLLKNNYKEKLNVEELAKNVNMATSSFYRNFKKVTKVSPLQYHKQLKLYEARKLMLSGNYDATEVCYKVGYESPTQFSREYKKMFGNPPLRDVKQLVIR